MRNWKLVVGGALAILVTCAWLIPATVASQAQGGGQGGEQATKYTAPRTPWGDPDLQAAVKWHTRYARQNGIHVSPTFMVGGIVPDDDAARLRSEGVARVYTPKDYDILGIVADMAEVAAGRAA